MSRPNYILPILYTLLSFGVGAQNFGTIPLKKANNTVVYLREVRNKVLNQNGYDYIVGLKDPSTDHFYPYKTEFTGTGFTLKDNDNFIYLVTVKHLAENLTDSSLVKFYGASKDTLFATKDVLFKTKNGTRWYFSSTSDIAIGKVKNNFSPELLYLPKQNLNDTSRLIFDTTNLIHHYNIPITILKQELSASFRDLELLAIGFPSGIGDFRNPKSTVSKFFRASSEIIVDNFSSPFFLIDDPSVDGLSGSPAFEAPKILFVDSMSLGTQHQLWSCVGMINGTFNDANGGKFTSVIPAKLILNEIDNVKKSSFILEEFHQNGQLWQELLFNEDKIIEVLSNYNSNGLPLDKGTLKNGNGTVNYYNEAGQLVRIDNYKNGVLIEK